MRIVGYTSLLILLLTMLACDKNNLLEVEIYQTSESGDKLKQIQPISGEKDYAVMRIMPDDKYQTILGIGGSFTEASAYLLQQLSKANQDSIMEAYFGNSGARYSLTRTHMNSCDFSLGNYSYAPVEGDKDLFHFSISEDMDDLVPMIKRAMQLSSDGFKLISSPWTAPPWMKDNKDWRGGKLLPEYYDTWALYFSKYLEAYKEQGIDVWGFTVENEPLGNDNNWESMHYTADEMNDFVKNHLGPWLRGDGHVTKILGYDQNRDEHLYEWVDTMYDDSEAAKYFDGVAVHWYASTYDYFPEALDYARKRAGAGYVIQTEACVDAQVPVWKDDNWYWSKEATDWGWDWAPADKKHLHPKYVPVFRYAGDIIGCLNHGVNGWIDWNMILDRQGGPNWFENWCVAPVIVDPQADEVYFTPLFYTMAQFSRFIRPDAVRIGFESEDKEIMVTAVQNTDSSIAVVLFNPTEKSKVLKIDLVGNVFQTKLEGKAIQTILIKSKA